MKYTTSETSAAIANIQLGKRVAQYSNTCTRNDILILIIIIIIIIIIIMILILVITIIIINNLLHFYCTLHYIFENEILQSTELTSEDFVVEFKVEDGKFIT